MQVGCAGCNPLMSACSLLGTGGIHSWLRGSAISFGEFSICRKLFSGVEEETAAPGRDRSQGATAKASS